MNTYIDIHTHDHCPDHRAIINLDPYDDIPDSSGEYSVGVHPWDTSRADLSELMKRVEEKARDHRIVMIGETGLDRLRGASAEIQMEYTRLHAMLAENTGKPLLLHVVHGFNEIIQLHKSMRPSVPWIIHGFRGKPELARQLLREGFHISLGEKFNTATAAIIPADHLYVESDTSTLPFSAIVDNVNNARNSCSQPVENRK